MSCCESETACLVAVKALIESRSATNFFLPSQEISEPEVRRLCDLATRAPSAFNLQNWKIDAVRSPAMKARLRTAAFGQVKVEQASVTFVISGEYGCSVDLAARLQPALDAGIMEAALVTQWVDMAHQTFADPVRARDEAIRSATLAGATLMLAAESRGWATAPMSGFDPCQVVELLDLPQIAFRSCF